MPTDRRNKGNHSKDEPENVSPDPDLSTAGEPLNEEALAAIGTRYAYQTILEIDPSNNFVMLAYPAIAFEY